jgi:multidrug resistance efflux pump
MKRYVCVFLALSLAVTGLCYWRWALGCVHAGGRRPGAAETSPPPLSAEGLGYVEPLSEPRKLTLRSGGVIRRCYVQAGDAVSRGDKLLELETATQQAEVALARMNLRLARAEAEQVHSGINPYQIKVAERAVERLQEKLRFCKSEYDRCCRLVGGQAISAQEHDTVKARLNQCQVELAEKQAELLHLLKHVTAEQRAVAEGKVCQAEAALKLADERRGEGLLLAPFDGTVLKVLKREGEGVRPFDPEPVLLFGDLSRLRVRAEIDERFAMALAVGQDAVIYGRNLAGKTYQGKVVTVEPVMGDKTLFTLASSERKNLDVIQVLIEMDPCFRSPTGLRVDVRVVCPQREDMAQAGAAPP